MQKNNVELQKQIKIHDSKIFMVVTNEAADEHTRFFRPAEPKRYRFIPKKKTTKDKTRHPDTVVYYIQSPSSRFTTKHTHTRSKNAPKKSTA
jgi:hypothetical protein